MKFYEKQSRTDLKVGIFVIVSLAILIFGYLWFINFLEEGSMTNLTIAFPETGSLELGDGVLVLGVNRGKVKAIKLDKNRVLVTIAVKLDEPLSEDSQFWVKNTSVMGSMRIIIIPGISEKILDGSKILQGNISPGISGLLDEAGSIMQELKTFLQNLNAEDNIVERYSLLADSLQTSVDSFNHILDRNQDNLAEIMKNMRDITRELLRLISTNSQTMETTLSGVEKLVADLQLTNASLHLFLENLQKEDSTLHELTNDDELYRSLLKSVSSLDSLLIDIKKNPKKYFTVKVF